MDYSTIILEQVYRVGKMVVYRKEEILFGEKRYVVYCGEKALEEFRRKDSAIKWARENPNG